MYGEMAFKRSNIIHVMDDRRGLQWLPWYAKSGYLGDKAISMLHKRVLLKGEISYASLSRYKKG